MCKKQPPNANSVSERMLYRFFVDSSSKFVRKIREKTEGKLSRKFRKNNFSTKAGSAENTVKTMLRATFFKNSTKQRKQNKTKKTTKIGQKIKAKKRTCSAVIFNAIFAQKTSIFGPNWRSGAPSCPKNAVPGAFRKMPKIQTRFGTHFCRIFAKSGPKMGSQKGSLQKQFLNIFAHFTPKN